MERKNSTECLVLGILTWMPHIITEGDPANPVITGTMLDVLDIFARRLGFCYKFVMSKDLTAGTQLQNGTWTGLMNQTLDKEITFTGLGLAINHHRSKVIDFSEYLYIDEWSAAFKRPQFQSDIVGFVKPYTAMAWLAILISMVIVGALFFLVQHFSEAVTKSRRVPAKGDRVDVKLPEEGISRDYLFTNSFYDAMNWTLASLLSQPLPGNLPGASVKIISGIWLVASLILGTVYRSNLKAMLILPTVNLPFDNLEELYRSGLKVWVPTGSIMHNAALESPSNSTLGRLRARFVGVDAPTDVPWGIRGMSSGKFVFAAPLSGIVQIIHSSFSKTGNCATYVMSESFFKTTLQCIFFPKQSPWKRKLDPLIIRLRESGILNHIYKKGVSNATECLKPVSSQGSTNLRPMDLGDFYGVFVVYTGGIVAVVVSFIAEVTLGSKRRLVASHTTSDPDVD